MRVVCPSERNANSNMKIDTLVFVHCLLANHPAEVFHPHVDRLLPCLVAAVNDPFYKITAEALHVLQELVRVIRPLGQSQDRRDGGGQRWYWGWGGYQMADGQ